MTTSIIQLIVLLMASGCKAQRQRQIWAWASGSLFRDEGIQQLYNSSWHSVIDGIQAWCGCGFSDTGILFNETSWNSCVPLIEAAKDSGSKFQIVISGAVPEAAIRDPTPFINDAIAWARLHPEIDGFSIDDERDCAPRSTVSELEGWVAFHDVFAEALRSHGLHVTSAVQAMFGVQNEANNEPCLFPPYGDKQRLPSDYDFVQRVPDLMSDSSIQKWLIMDTYYYSTGHFLTTLDWHTQHISNDKLAVGMSNLINYRDHWTIDELQARFYAIDKSGIEWINIFILPANDDFLPFLKRWKSFCQGCGKQPTLGCYDFDVECAYDIDLPIAETQLRASLSDRTGNNIVSPDSPDVSGISVDDASA